MRINDFFNVNQLVKMTPFFHFKNEQKLTKHLDPNFLDTYGSVQFGIVHYNQYHIFQKSYLGVSIVKIELSYD